MTLDLDSDPSKKSRSRDVQVQGHHSTDVRFDFERESYKSIWQLWSIWVCTGFHWLRCRRKHQNGRFSEINFWSVVTRVRSALIRWPPWILYFSEHAISFKCGLSGTLELSLHQFPFVERVRVEVQSQCLCVSLVARRVGSSWWVVG